MELSQIKALIDYWTNKEDDAVRSGMYYRSRGDVKYAEEYKQKAKVARDKAQYWRRQLTETYPDA